MQMVNAALISIGICGAAMLTAQEPSSLAVANAIDQEILKPRDLPGDVRARAIKDLAFRIRRGRALRCCPRVQPCNRRDRRMRARHLAGSGNDSRRRAAEVATPGYRRSCVPDVGRTGPILSYGGFARCYPRYTAAISKLQADDQHRNEADFTLTDVQERKWNLKSLRGKVVLVNFLATWCPPCRREIPDLDALYKRFRDQGLVILAITGEEASIVRSEERRVGKEC